MTTYEKEMILSFKRGAVSVCQASSTGENIIASLEIAEHIAKDSERGRVQYINTVQTERQLASEIRKNICKDYSADKSDPRLTYLSSTPGLLAALGKQIRRILDSGVRFIIINSLEFASKDHRRKDELLYQIMDWTNLYGAAVLIFSEEVNTDPVTGKIHRGGGGIGKLSALAKNIFHITSEADRKEPVDFKTSMSSVVLEDDDDDFSELDKRILAAAAEDIAAIESAPNWKPANHKEELAIYEAYMKNHPELKFTEGVILSNRRDHVMRLIAAEKKKQQKAEKKRAILGNQPKVLQTYLPDKSPISSDADEEIPLAAEEPPRARVLLM